MNAKLKKVLYSSIMTNISKVIKKQLNENYYSDHYLFKDLKFLNNYGHIGDILLINELNEFRIIETQLYESKLFGDVSIFNNEEEDIHDIIYPWKNFAVCLDTGVWVYLDWIGLNTKLRWAKKGTLLYSKNSMPNNNGLETTQYILDNFHDDIPGTLWEYIDKSKYPIYIPDKKQIQRIRFRINEIYKLLPLDKRDGPTIYYWSNTLNLFYDKAVHAICFNDNIWESCEKDNFFIQLYFYIFNKIKKFYL